MLFLNLRDHQTVPLKSFGRLARHRRLRLCDPGPHGRTVAATPGKLLTYSKPAFFGELAFMLWLVIKGAEPPALDAAALSSAAALARSRLHVPSLKLTAHGIPCHGFATINACRNAIAQVALSGGSSRESLRSLLLRITGWTATTEPQS
jgi:hypothetical protein